METKAAVNAAIYCRISRDKEGAGLGVKRQEEDCRELAASLGWSVTRVFSDNDISAYSGKRRPEYELMLDQMRAGRIHGVLTWHTDRLHRSPRELETYIDASEASGVVTHTVKAGEIDLSTPSGRAVARTLGAWARYESEHKSERIVRKKRQLAQDGAFSGGPVPFGWRLRDGTPVVDEGDAAEIKKAIHGFIAGRSIGYIVKDLNERGVKTRRNQLWTSTAVRNMLLRPTNAGLSAYHGEIMGTSVFPPIISEDEWRTVTSILRNPSRLTQNGSKVRHLLAGLMLCGKCGQPMKTSSRSSPHGQVYYYKCPTQGEGHSFQNAGPVEEMIAEVVVGVLSRPDAGDILGTQQDAESVAEMRRQADTLRLRLDEAANSFAEGAISAKQLGIITARVNNELEQVELTIATLRSGSVLADRSGSPAAVRAWWDSAGIEDRRAVIDALMTINVDPVRKSAPRKFDPERIRIEWKTV